MSRSTSARLLAALVTVLAGLALAACGDDDEGAGGAGDAPLQTGPMLFASDSFVSGQAMPAEFTCEGEDVSPPLTWDGVPDDAVTLALLLEDPDARGFVHWVVYDIPVNVSDLPQDVPDGDTTDFGARQGINSFGDAGYGGPCPPSGEEHEYVFSLYALDSESGLAPGAEAAEVKAFLAEHTLAMSQISALFAR